MVAFPSSLLSICHYRRKNGEEAVVWANLRLIVDWEEKTLMWWEGDSGVFIPGIPTYFSTLSLEEK